MLFGKEKITKEVYIDGMSCMHCAANVEKALSSLKGVSGVKVDLNGKKATVGYCPEVWKKWEEEG